MAWSLQSYRSPNWANTPKILVESMEYDSIWFPHCKCGDHPIAVPDPETLLVLTSRTECCLALWPRPSANCGMEVSRSNWYRLGCLQPWPISRVTLTRDDYIQSNLVRKEGVEPSAQIPLVSYCSATLPYYPYLHSPTSRRRLYHLSIHALYWLRRVDLNHWPLGYEPSELPDCSTPQKFWLRLQGSNLRPGD